MKETGRLCVLLGLLLSSLSLLYAQPGTTLRLRDQKPAEYAKKLLRAEKTGYGDLGKFQQFMQNTFTRFNYVFNANKHMEDLLEKATSDYKEDYAGELSYYPYDAKAMATNGFLDSVIQHATAGILLHDLRNAYVDELYFLLGKAYYYQQKYDTAHQVFQYLNYAFAPKDDGYDLPIGSNISKMGDHFTILNPEHKGISKNSYARKERRNDGILWQVKNYIQSGDYIQAQVLMGYLSKDSLLPERLLPELNETKGFLFFKLKQYDSAAAYLSASGYKQYNRSTRPRMYYLTGQLYEKGGDSLEAANYYAKAKNAALDPLLNIYAALSEASMKNAADSSELSSNSSKMDRHLALLNRLSKRDKYKRYRDVIYYAEAAIALKKGDLKAAKERMITSIEAGKKIVPANNWQKSRTYFSLAGVDYKLNEFYDASRFYDSVNASDLSRDADKELLELRQPPLNKVAGFLDSVYFQDSLQRLVNMPEKERMKILSKRAREIRRSIQEKEQNDQGPLNNNAVRRQNQPTSLFPTTGRNTPWYFNNATLKASGYQLFRQKFGNRPNVDNWQRISAINNASKSAIKSGDASSSIFSDFNLDGSLKVDSSNIQPEDLLRDLPLKPEQLAASNDKIASSLFGAAQVLQNSMENFTGALFIYDSLLKRLPSWDSTDVVYFNQYICWTLLGEKDKAASILARLQSDYKNSPWTQKILKGMAATPDTSETSLKNEATYAYNEVYQLFVQGEFAKADALKQIADQKYGPIYWTPQLLYIEAVYYISERKDTLAKEKLEYLLKNFASSDIRPQAQHLLNILNRRAEIEAYLASLLISPEGYIINSRLSNLESAAAALADLRERRIRLLRDQNIIELSDSSNSVKDLHGQV